MAYPTVHDMLYRRHAVARQMAFENLNWVQEARLALLRNEIEPDRRIEVKSMIISTLQKARRNGESAKFSGCSLYRF
jgi:hypothetical protein